MCHCQGRQYTELGVITVCGGIEVARTEERMEELRRRMSSATSWGIEGCSLVTPAEVKELVPYIDENVILGGFYSEGVSVVDSLRAGTLMRERAQELGALTVSANTEVLGIDVERGRVRRVRTTRGDVEAEVVIVACGVWSPMIAAALFISRRTATTHVGNIIGTNNVARKMPRPRILLLSSRARDKPSRNSQLNATAA